MNEPINRRETALAIIQKEYELDDSKVKEMTKIINKASIDDVDRMLDMFLRFGVREVLDAVGENQQMQKELAQAVRNTKAEKKHKHFETGDRVYHTKIQQYGTFVSYACESDEECYVDFDPEKRNKKPERRYVSTAMLMNVGGEGDDSVYP